MAYSEGERDRDQREKSSLGLGPILKPGQAKDFQTTLSYYYK